MRREARGGCALGGCWQAVEGVLVVGWPGCGVRVVRDGTRQASGTLGGNQPLPGCINPAVPPPPAPTHAHTSTPPPAPSLYDLPPPVPVFCCCRLQLCEGEGCHLPGGPPTRPGHGGGGGAELSRRCTWPAGAKRPCPHHRISREALCRLPVLRQLQSTATGGAFVCLGWAVHVLELVVVGC